MNPHTEEYDETDEAPAVVTPTRKADIRQTPLPDGAPDVPFDPEYYPLDDCAITRRDGGEEYPFEGMGVWLSPYEAGCGMIEGATGFASGKSERVANAFPALRAGLAEAVVWHNLGNPATGAPYPQVWGDPDGALAWPSTVVFHVWSLVVNGEPPTARPKGSPRGGRGRTTPATTGRKRRS